MTKHLSEKQDAPAALEPFLRDLRLTYNLMRGLADELHADLQITATLRAIMEFVAMEGASTVPQIAARRSVSRQGIQKSVNALLDRGLLRRAPNPEHQRSDLIELTGEGRATFRKMRRREQKYLRRLEAGLSERDLATAGGVLSKLRAGLGELAAREGGQS